MRRRCSEGVGGRRHWVYGFDGEWVVVRGGGGVGVVDVGHCFFEVGEGTAGEAGEGVGAATGHEMVVVRFVCMRWSLGADADRV